jgi:cholesterol transport system auxiliary component
MSIRRPTLAMAMVIVLGPGVLGLGGCGSLFESSLPSVQAYVLRLPPRAAAAEGTSAAGTVRVQRPEAGPGLDSDRIALLRSERRFDVYSGTRWAAPAPDLLESVIVDQLRGTGMFSGVFDDSSPYAPHYNLRCGLNRFEADYTAGGEPSIHVALDCSFGRYRDRTLLANFIAQGSAVASDDRVGAVVAAFESATAKAMGELERNLAGALAAETPR